MKNIFSVITLLLTFTIVSAQNNIESRAGKVQLNAEMSWGYVMPTFGEVGKYVESDFSMGVDITAGSRYYATENFFVEGMAGYKFLSISSHLDGDNNKIHNTILNVTIPLHFGFYYSTTTQLFAGARIDIPVSAKSEYKDEESKIDVPTTVLIEGGITFKGVLFKIGYSPAEKNKYTMISIGYKL